MSDESMNEKSMREKIMQNTIPFILEVITPVTIGNGQDLKVLDYILDTAKQKVYILNQKKWLQYLYSIDKLSEYESYVENYTKGEKETIYEWMKRTIGIPKDSVLSSVSKQQLGYEPSSTKKKSLNDIKLCMSLSDGKSYIPGSSLKGVIIASIIAYIIKDKEEFREEWREKFVDGSKKLENSKKGSKNQEELKRNLEKIIEDYEEILDILIFAIINGCGENLNTSKLTEIKKSVGEGVKDGVKQLFHAIAVSDIMLSNNDSMATYILPRFDSVIRTNTDTTETKKHSLPIYRECIIPNTKLKGMLSVDFTELRKIGIKTKYDLIKIIEEHTQRLVSRWKLAFNKGIEESCIQELEQVTCLLGSSVGFLHKTLLLPLFDNQRGEVNEDEVNVVRSILGLQSQSKDHGHDEDKIISPRTLKLTKYAGKHYIFGGVKLHFETD